MYTYLYWSDIFIIYKFANTATYGTFTELVLPGTA
jgi:hypothetical protein